MALFNEMPFRSNGMSMSELLLELKVFGMKFLGLALSAPFFGFALLKLSEEIEKAWKSNDKKKKWIALCLAYFVFAILSGFLR